MSLARMRKAGISILEYAVLITAVVVALAMAQTALRRAVCAKWRDAADVFGSGRQYENQGSKTTTIN